MQKFKRFKELLWILLILVFAIAVVWFLVKMVYRVGHPDFTSEEGEMMEEAGIDYYAGNLVEWGENFMKISDSALGDVEINLYEGTQYQLRNPLTGVYEDYAREYVLPGTQVYVELADVSGVKYASRVMAETTTVLAGRVKDIAGDVLTIEDYAGTMYPILVGQSTVIFKTGGEELTLSDIELDKDIVVNSARAYEPGTNLEAGWIEVVDEREFVNNK